jgi:NAD(P)-dependent dehydrogenase (short-subunit alcohol dehydrogenase family)
LIGTRIFALGDQVRFAELTGDFNPMHLDPVAARRTLAGAPVVHGIHDLLWLIDLIAARHPNLPTVAGLKVHFAKMLYLGEQAQVAISKLDERQLRAKVSVEHSDIMQITLEFGGGMAFSSESDRFDFDVEEPETPAELDLVRMEGRAGRLAFARPAGDLAKLFPHASRLIGAQRVAALGCTTRLVGMVIPGLHSIYAGLELAFVKEAETRSSIGYRVESIDENFRFVRTRVSGAGVLGYVDAFNRPSPTRQPSLAEVRRAVAANEFEGDVALIVGGSRGLGELTAKIIAAGGGKVILTYAVGKADAEAVAGEIVEGGGLCETVRFDVREQPGHQLSSIGTTPTNIYYFATPSIFRRRSAQLSLDLFEEFNSYYVRGFYALLDFVSREFKSDRKIGVFYPSSSAIDERPENMTEYSMSKIAAEQMCKDLARYFKGVRVLVKRLPRLLTDQTATISSFDTVDTMTVMLPIVRDVQCDKG